MHRTVPAHLTTRRLGIVSIVATAALLSGCGGSTKSLSAASKPAASSAGTPAGSVSPAPADATSPTSAPAVSASADAQVSADASVAPGGGGPSSSFCQLAKENQAQAAQEESQVVNGTPAEIKDFFQKDFALAPVYVAAAPAAIKASLTTLIDADRKLYAALQANNYDFTKASTVFGEAEMDPSFLAAAKSVGAYLTKVCGLTPATP